LVFFLFHGLDLQTLSTRYEQCDQSHSDHDTICASECIWSYISQFSAIFNDPGSKIKGVMCENMGI
jgi:hypothetical protein